MRIFHIDIVVVHRYNMKKEYKTKILKKMKRIVMLTVCAMLAVAISAQESVVKLSGGMRIASSGFPRIGLNGSYNSPNPSADFALDLSAKNLTVSWVLMRDLVDKTTKSNMNYLSAKYNVISEQKFKLTPEIGVLLFDEHNKSSSLALSRLFLNYTGNVQINGFIGYGIAFHEPNLFVSNVTVSKTLQGWTFRVGLWEVVKAGKYSTNGAVQVNRKLFSLGDATFSALAGWHVKNILTNPESTCWMGVGINY